MTQATRRMEHEMMKMAIRTSEVATRGGGPGVTIVFLVLVIAVAFSCNGSDESAGRAATNSTNREIHADLPAEPRAGATTGDPSAPWEGASGIAPHEHEPQHGGVVRSVDVYHVELTKKPVQVWLYDRRGNSLPVDDLDGQLVVYSGNERHPYTLAESGDHLAPVEPVSLPDEGSAFVELTLEKQTFDVAYELPLESPATPEAG